MFFFSSKEIHYVYVLGYCEPNNIPAIATITTTNSNKQHPLLQMQKMPSSSPHRPQYNDTDEEREKRKTKNHELRLRRLSRKSCYTWRLSRLPPRHKDQLTVSHRLPLSLPGESPFPWMDKRTGRDTHRQR